MMIENSILRDRIKSCEMRQTIAAVLISMGVVSQSLGEHTEYSFLEGLGVIHILAGLGILVYSMYRSAVDY